MWPGGMREAIKSAAPVAGVSETMSKVCPKLEGLALPYPPTDVVHCAGHPPYETSSASQIFFFRFFFRPKFDLTFDRPKNYFFGLFW